VGACLCPALLLQLYCRHACRLACPMQLRRKAGSWDAPSPEALCMRRHLGPATRVGGPGSAFHTLLDPITGSRYRHPSFSLFLSVNRNGRTVLVLEKRVLYYTVLYCTALYCTVLYCTVLYCTVTSMLLLCVGSGDLVCGAPRGQARITACLAWPPCTLVLAVQQAGGGERPGQAQGPVPLGGAPGAAGTRCQGGAIPRIGDFRLDVEAQSAVGPIAPIALLKVRAPMCRAVAAPVQAPTGQYC